MSDSFPELFKEAELGQCSQLVILVDENTRAYCLPQLLNAVEDLKAATILEIPAGEHFKNIDTCEHLWGALFEKHVDRKGLMINLGGGVITDMGGFVAATYKRGIDFINIPTTLLSQVDATIGGKQGIDFENIKNGIGLFKNPKAVLINPGFLKTLDQAQLLSGYAEIIKHGLIQDESYWETLQKTDPLAVADWNDIIEHSLQIKKKIVEEDPYERNIRKQLNFGHTIGHALESLALSKGIEVLHGHAVAWGMIGEAFLSHRVTGLPDTELQQIQQCLLKFYKKFLDKKLLKEDLLHWMYQDKKNEQENFKFTLLKTIGEPVIDVTCSEKDIFKAIDHLRGLL